MGGFNMSCSDGMTHSVNDRDITVSLIEQSEFAKYGQVNKNKVNKIFPGEWADAVVGWFTDTVIMKSASLGTNVKKKRTVERSFTDLNFQNQVPVDDYWSNSSNVSEIKLRCVGDQEKTFPIPPWKSNIEQGTYRYIPDNGSYRTLKFMYDDRRDWYTIRKRHPEKVSTAWHQNCKRLQREMRRQLKKDISRAERERACGSARTSSTMSSVEPVSGGETSRSNSFIYSKTDNQSERSTPNKTDYQVNFKPNADGETDKPVPHIRDNSKPGPRKEMRVKSTHSDGAVSQLRKMKTIHEREVEMFAQTPQCSIPSSSQMLKSASDLFVENFSTRISALEEEIKKDSKWLRKSENESTKIQNSRPKYREQPRTNTRESGGSTSTTPRQQFRTETLGCEVFSVKPMVQKDLKPVEKSKSFNKGSHHGQGDSFHRDVRRVPPAKASLASVYHNTNDALINGGPEIDHSQNNYSSANESNSQALMNTLTGVKINTNNSKKSSKGFTTPSTITLCDNNSNQTNSGNQLARHLEPYKHIVLEKKDKKEAVQNVPALANIPALLPEISGKRLEVTSFSHRLL